MSWAEDNNMKIKFRQIAIVAVLIFSFLLTNCSGASPVQLGLPTPAGLADIKLSVGITPAPYPQIVRQNPLPGERISLHPTLEINFDRPMEPQKTAAAWLFLDKDGRTVLGKINWSTPQTFQFQPDLALQAGQTYTGVFSTQASSADGTSLPQELRLVYTTTGELQVGQVFPADQAVNVDRKSAITVIFNKPVMPLMSREAQAQQPSPISIQPSLSGAGNWVSSSVYVFQPENGLQSGTDYKVSVPAGLKDITGAQLAADYTWGFTTSAPAVMDFGLKNVGQSYTESITNVKLDQAFLVTFNQPMDQASVKKALSLRNIETGQDFPFQTGWNSASTVLTITPTGQLAIASSYDLSVAVSAASQDGGALKAPYDIKLATVPLPAVSGVPDGKQDSFSSIVSIIFNTAMNPDSLKDLVKVSPAPSSPVTTFYREGENRLDIMGLEPSQLYVIHLLAGAADIYGNTINTPLSFSLQTAGLSPEVRLVTPYNPLIYRQKSDQGIYLEYTNLRSAKISLYKLNFNEFTGLLSGTPELDNLSEGSGSLLREWTPELKAGKDLFARVLIRLDDQKPLDPGYYYLGLNAKPVTSPHRFLQGALLIVSNDSLSLKATNTEALAWLVDSESGQPVANAPVVFYDDAWKAVGQAVTDKDGLAHLQDIKNVQFVQSMSDTNLALAALSWGSGVSEGRNGIWTDYWTPIKSIFAYTYTERPLYRPNQPVYIKGILRNNDDLHYSLPTLAKVYLTIENDQGKLYGGYVSLSKDGTFAYNYQLGADAPVGNYTITVRETDTSEASLSMSDFRVAEYVKPQFQVTTAVDHPIVLDGDPLKFSLDAAYYSGGSLSNAKVAWFMEMQPYTYSPPPAYGAYSFSDFDYYDYYNNGGNGTSGPPVVKEGQGQTDEKGHFEMTQTMQLPKAGVSQQVAIGANVTDVGGNLVGSNTSLTLLGSALHAGIRPEDYVSKAGEPQAFKLVTLDMDGKPVANRDVSVSFVEQRWFSVIRKDDNGVARWETSVKNIPAGTVTATTDANGLASVSFTPPNGGQFKATITALDDQQRSATASAYLWVSSTDFIPWRETNDRSFQLVADKNSYAPGETAKILIAQPSDLLSKSGENYALVTVERGHIYQTEVVKLQNNSTLYSLPVTSDMAPVMYVSVMVVKAADGKAPPDFKIGLLRININPSRQNIFVSLQSDKTTAGPGDTVTYTVNTKDADGKPVPADVSLALVDKAVLALAPSNTSPLLDVFYPLRGLSVQSASSIVLNAEDFNAKYQETAPTGQHAGSGGGKGEGATGIITVRQNFKDTAFWQAQVLTDASGSAQVQVTLPDNLTTWQMTARAVTDDTRVGETTSELLSTRPLQIQLTTPRFFVVEDAVTLGAVVHNNTSQTLSVKTSLQAEGLTLNSPAEVTVDVPANQQAYVTWDGVVASKATRVDLVASAVSGTYSDSTRPELGTLPGQGLPVLSYHVTETVGSSGMLREAGSATEAINLPTSLAALDTGLNLNVSPSLAASMTDGLTYLNDYEYLCMEQTVSRFLPNLVSLEALKLAGKDTASLQQNLDKQVQPALQRIISNQNPDGGWGLWPGSQSDPTSTSYVIVGLVEARKAGYTFPDGTLDQGTAYLQAQVQLNPGANLVWQHNQAAFELYALALGGKPDGGGVSTLYADHQKMGLYGKAFLMQAMWLAQPGDARIQTLLSELNTAAAKSAASAWWSEKEVDYWNWNTDVRSTAIILNALIQVDPKNVLIPDGIRWLMKHRDGAHWYSTQETSWSLMALTNWLALSGEFQTNYQYAIGLNGNLLGGQQADAAHLSEGTNLRLGADRLLTDKTNYLVLTRSAGPGTLYYTAYMDYSLPVKDIPALDQGVLVTQQYFSTTDLKTPISAAAQGDLLQVRLTLVVPQSLHYVVIDDPLPAGLEAVDASLSTSQDVPTQYQSQDYDKFGWGWWYFYYKQIYDQKVVMSADYLPAGTYTINYLARAATAGTFHVLPATAKEFYFPDVSGRSASAEFVVKP